MSRFQVVRSWRRNWLRWVWPQARARTFISSTEASKKRCSRLAAICDRQARAQVRLLGRDADRAVVGVAGAHAEAADGLDRGVRDRDAVGAQRQRLDEVGRGAQAAGDDQRDVAGGRARSRWRRARASAGMVGTEMLSLKMFGAAPVPPPRPSRMM